MKILKWVGLVLIGAIAVILLVGLFSPKTVVMARSTTIAATPEIVFEQVNNLHRWSHWSPFVAKDPTMEVQVHGPAEGVGSQMLWQNQKGESGMMIITASKPNRYIAVNLDFEADGLATGSWTFSPAAGGTVVTWSTTVTDLSYPLGRVMGLFMNSMMQPYYKLGFERLNRYCQAVADTAKAQSK